ncbi:MAG: hypothetical protein EOO27_09405 [Comamonadaceae bacterium]|nr:MAG: hypothetical protein EOO27_09405 [Comamonadaceae bacterium]
MTKQKIILVGNIGRTPAVTIGDAELSMIEYFGRRVVTLGQVDAVHQRPRGTARRNFNANRQRLIPGEEYMQMSADEFRTRFPGVLSDRATGNVTMAFETGYLMLVKSFNDDLAWTVQRQLVTNYFRHDRQTHTPAPAIAYSLGKSDTLNLEEQNQLRDTLKAAAERLPREQQGGFLMRGWSKRKSHFKTGHYREIPRRDFVEALSILQRHAVECMSPMPATRPAAIGHATSLQQTVEGFASIVDGFARVLPGLVSVLRDVNGVQALTEPATNLTAKPASNARRTTRQKLA